MGGRGSRSGMSATSTAIPPIIITAQSVPQPQPPQPQPAPVNLQPPNDQNTPVIPDAIANLTDMTDDELAQAVIDSRTAQMPNMLNDVADQTQRFIYTIGANAKPQVLDDTAFSQFMSDNGISQSDVMSRSIDDIVYTNADGTRVNMTADKVSRLLKYSRFNYIGGKVGGQAYGAGTYFERNGGINTGYGSRTLNAVLNPNTARVITDRTLMQKIPAFEHTHPKFAAAVGGLKTGRNGNLSIYAMAMGYNVIRESSNTNTYFNVIDRQALVYRRDDR